MSVLVRDGKKEENMKTIEGGYMAKQVGAHIRLFDKVFVGVFEIAMDTYMTPRVVWLFFCIP